MHLYNTCWDKCIQIIQVIASTFLFQFNVQKAQKSISFIVRFTEECKHCDPMAISKQCSVCLSSSTYQLPRCIWGGTGNSRRDARWRCNRSVWETLFLQCCFGAAGGAKLRQPLISWSAGHTDKSLPLAVSSSGAVVKEGSKSSVQVPIQWCWFPSQTWPSQRYSEPLSDEGSHLPTNKP